LFLPSRVFPEFCCLLRFFAFPKLTGEFTSLEEPSDDSSITTVLGLLADGSGFVESERRDEPDGLMRMLKLPIVNSVS
jgi:hypothetical protein